MIAKLDDDARRALQETVELLRSLGHEVDEHDLDYTPALNAEVMSQVTRRYLRGVHDEVAELPHPERLERRTRAMSRIGGLIPLSLLERSLAGEAELRAQAEPRVRGPRRAADARRPPRRRRASASCRAAARCGR